MKALIHWGVSVFLTMAVVDLSAQTQTATNKTAKPTAVTSQEKKASAGPFHAKLVAVDKTARTITVGKRTFLITSETKINKSGKPAKLEEGVIGEPVSGYVKPNEKGHLVATTVNFGSKGEPQATNATHKKK